MDLSTNTPTAEQCLKTKSSGGPKFIADSRQLADTQCTYKSHSVLFRGI
jgi:hypothetical protein